MPQALVNNSLDNLIMGVSQQYPEGRHEGQMETLINCVPSITRGILRRNPISKRVDLPGLTLNPLILPYTYFYDRGNGEEQYVFIIPGDSVGTWHVYNVNDVSQHWTGTEDYFKIPANTDAKVCFKALTLRDSTFIVNTTIEVEQSTGNNSLNVDDYEKKAFYWIKQVTQVLVAQKTDNSTGATGSRLEGYKYTLNGKTVQGIYEGRPGETAVNRISADAIAQELKNQLGAGYEHPSGTSYVYNLNATQWEWTDTDGDLASLGVWKTVDVEADLPAQIPSGIGDFIVKVTGGSGVTKDDYYLKYNQSTGTWDECAAPGIKAGLNPATMPHTLVREYNGGNITFTVSEFKKADGSSGWIDRTVGDMETNPDPSFVGEVINDIFFYKNRLGIIAANKVVLSTIADYGSFYVRALRTILDDGPIDITVATRDSVNLTAAIASEDTLVLFDKNAQFLLHSGVSPLTPKTAVVNVLSHYDFNPEMEPIGVGTQIMFSSKSGGFSQLFELQVNNKSYSDTSEITADNITQHLPSYLEANLIGNASDTGIGQVFIQPRVTSNILYVINSASVNGQTVQKAFHTWLFKDDIVGIGTLIEKLFIVFADGTLGEMELVLPGTLTETYDASGTLVPAPHYADVRADGSEDPYTSGIELSTQYYRGVSEKGTPRGRFQIRTIQYAFAEGSSWRTFLQNSVKYAIHVDNMFSETYNWDDSNVWDDTKIWVDETPLYVRQYLNDEKITVMSNNENVKIVITENPYEPTVGFELQVINVEGLFYQRSSRVRS